jgi:hypothetical protein
MGQEVGRGKHNQQGQSGTKARSPSRAEDSIASESAIGRPTSSRLVVGRFDPRELEARIPAMNSCRAPTSDMEPGFQSRLNAVHQRTGLRNNTATRCQGSSNSLPRDPLAHHGDQRRIRSRSLGYRPGWRKMSRKIDLGHKDEC